MALSSTITPFFNFSDCMLQELLLSPTHFLKYCLETVAVLSCKKERKIIRDYFYDAEVISCIFKRGILLNSFITTQILNLPSTFFTQQNNTVQFN